MNQSSQQNIKKIASPTFEWSLYRKSKGQLVGGLTSREMKLVVFAICHRLPADWLICHASWQEWSELSDFIQQTGYSELLFDTEKLHVKPPTVLIGLVLIMFVFAASAGTLDKRIKTKSRTPASSTALPSTPPSTTSSTYDNGGAIAFVEQIKGMYERSLSRQNILRKVKEAQAQAFADRQEDPWQVTSSGSISEITSAQSSANTFNVKPGLQYMSANGFSFEVSDSKVDSNNRAKSSDRIGNTLGVSVGYEFMKKGKALLEGYRLSDLNFLMAKINAEGEYLAQVKNYIEYALRLYSLQCRIRDTQRLESLLAQTLTIVDTRVAAKTVDSGEALRVRELYLSFQKNLLALKQESASIENYLESLGSEASAMTHNLVSNNLDCDRLKNDNLIAIEVIDNEREGITAWQPQIATLRVQKEVIRHKLKSLQISKLPTMQVTGGVNKFLTDVNAYSNYDVYNVGLSFQYNFPGDQAETTRSLYNRQIENLEYSVEDSTNQMRRQISTFYETMANQANLSKIAKLSMENSEKQLNMVQTRQGLGMMDADVIYSAYSNYSSAIQATRDIWLNYRTSQLTLDEHKRAAIRVQSLR